LKFSSVEALLVNVLVFSYMLTVFSTFAGIAPEPKRDFNAIFAKYTSRSSRNDLLMLNTQFDNISRGRPLADFAKDAIRIGRIGHPHYTGAHSSRKSGLQYLQALDAVLLEDLKSIPLSSSVLSVSLDESTDVGTVGHLCIHTFFVQGYERKHAFVDLATIKEHPNASYLLKLLLATLHDQLGLTPVLLRSKLVQFASDGASVMTGDENCLGQRVASTFPFSNRLHCYAHRLDLCAKGIEKQVPLVAGL
jgi:hypothetical protein